MKWQRKAALGLSLKSPTSAARRSKKYFKIFSTDSKKCVIIEGFADRGEDDKNRRQFDSCREVVVEVSEVVGSLTNYSR